MKLCIWQQFSSNHSGVFWIVGSFETPEKAESAYHELRQILIDIDRWHQAHPEAEQQLQLEKHPRPLPPEVEIAERYGVNWPFSIDWTNWAQYYYRNSPHEDFRRIGEHAAELAAQLIDEAITVVGNLVYISNPDQTWMGIEPFAGIVGKIGATPIFAVDIETDFSNGQPWEAWIIRVACRAKDETSAQALLDTIRPHLGRKTENEEPIAPPWNEYEANLHQILDRSSILRKQLVETLVAEGARHLDFIVEPYKTRQRKKRVVISGGNIARDGSTLVIDQPLALPLTVVALVAYLEVQGCTNIECSLIAPEGYKP